MSFDHWLHFESFHEKIESIMCFFGIHCWERATFEDIDAQGSKQVYSLRQWFRRCEHCKKEQRKEETVVETKWS